MSTMRHKGWEPRKGDPCVDLRLGVGVGRMGSATSWADRAGSDVTVTSLTPTMVITSDGERYNRKRLCPVSEGPYSDRVLVPVWDDRVLCARGREMLREVARLATNLSAIDRMDPADVFGAFAQILAKAGSARQDYSALTVQASAMKKGARP